MSDRKSTIAEFFTIAIAEFQVGLSQSYRFERVTPNKKSDRAITPATLAIAIAIAFSDRATKLVLNPRLPQWPEISRNCFEVLETSFRGKYALTSQKYALTSRKYALTPGGPEIFTNFPKIVTNFPKRFTNKIP